MILGWSLVPSPTRQRSCRGLAVPTMAIGAFTGGDRRGRPRSARTPGRLEVRGHGRRGADAARRSFRRPSVIAVAMLIGLAYQALVVLEVWLLSEALSSTCRTR